MRSQRKRLIFNQIRTQILFLTTLLNPALITSTTRALEHSTTTRAEKKKKKILFFPVAFYHRPQRIRNRPSPPPVLLLSITWNFPLPSGRPVSHPKCISDSPTPNPRRPPGAQSRRPMCVLPLLPPRLKDCQPQPSPDPTSSSKCIGSGGAAGGRRRRRGREASHMTRAKVTRKRERGVGERQQRISGR